MSHLIVLAGPTAVGKTELSLHIAKYFQAEIISADSRQFFQEMNIGTAKPSPEELQRVKHYFINSHSITQDYNVGKYEQDVLALLQNYFKKKSIALLVGGSGLYIKAVCEGLDEMPAVVPKIRTQLIQKWQTEGIAVLQNKLQQLDPQHYMQIDLQNPHRLIRALEVCLSTGKPYSSFRGQAKLVRPFQVYKIALDRPREELYARIDARMDKMIGQGLFQEVAALQDFKHLQALQTVGYSEIFEFLAGKYNWEEALRLLKRNSRRYAKRQLTWFRKDTEFEWFHPLQSEEIITYLKAKMKSH